MIDPSSVIEMLLYVKYMLILHKPQTSVIGSITDGAIIHSVNFEEEESSGKLIINGCAHFKDNVPASIPAIIKHFGYSEIG